MLKAGDILLGPYPPGSGKIRRFLILCDEVPEPNPEVAWVYLSTSMSDRTCILAPGCHPDITKECCVVFEEAAVVSVSELVEALRRGALTLSVQSLPIDTLAKAQEGVFDSDETPTRVVNFCTNRI